MIEPITYVGIDAHKAELQVAVLAPDAAEPTIWTVRNEARLVDRLRRRLEKVAPGPIACCYEAGPCGYALQRQLERDRVRCDADGHMKAIQVAEASEKALVNALRPE